MSIAVHTFGQLKAVPGDEAVAEFVDNALAVFALAERSDGFIWRFDRDASEQAQADRDAYSREPNMVVTLSVWQNIES